MWSNAPTSSGSPLIHAAKPGAASRLFSRIASAKRSFDGKNESRSITPTRSTGGDWISWIKAPQVEVAAVRPRVGEQRGQQDVLAALDRVGVDAEEVYD